jgi:hypothetical protein
MEGQRAGRNVSETVGINEAESSFQGLTGVEWNLKGESISLILCIKATWMAPLSNVKAPGTPPDAERPNVTRRCSCEA